MRRAPRHKEHGGVTTLLGGEKLALLARVSDSVSVNGKHSFALGQAWRVVDFADALLTAALAQVEACRGRVRHDVATNGLLGIGGEHGRAVHLCHNCAQGGGGW